MLVILLQDLPKVGNKYDIKEVADGYARNFLIPKNLAKEATEQALKWVALQKEIALKRVEEDLKGIQTRASDIDGVEITLPVKVGDEGQLFESIGQQKIAEKLKEAGFDVKKNQIMLEIPLKELGEFPIKLKFDHNLEAEIKVIITEEK